MTKADLRHKSYNYGMKPFITHCQTCDTPRKHTAILTAFGESEKGPTIRKAGYCTECWAINEKTTLIKPVKFHGAKEERRQEFCLVV